MKRTKPIDFKSFGDKTAPEENVANRRWWLETAGESIAQGVAAVLTSIVEFDGRRQTQYQISARLYGNADILGVNGMSMSKSSQTNATSLKDRISYNVIQSAIDTVTAKIAKNRPKPLFLTSGGDYKIQRKAKKLTKFIDGVFYKNEMAKKGPEAFRDCEVFGDGILHVFPNFQTGEVEYERVIPSELYVDIVDSFYGNPRQMHRVKNVDRDVLIEKFPEHKTKIMNCSEARSDLYGVMPQVVNQLAVAESWHLPSGPDAGDGLHVITITGETLFKEEWTEEFFPFAKMCWSKRLFGYWGQGAAEQIQNIQLEINKLLWVIQRSMHLAGSFKIFIENSSKIVKEHLSNDIGTIIAYTGTQPTYLTPPIVPPEIYAHLVTLKNQAFEQLGVSQLSAASKKPEGLDSGKALREFNDIETERFMINGQAYENFHLDLARLTQWAGKKLYDKDKKFAVKVPGKKFIETIPWKEVSLDDDQYILKMFPTSSLPTDPSGRLATVQEYMQAGLYSPRTAKRLLDFPDLEAVDDLQSAEEDYIHQILEKMIEEEDVDAAYTPPSPDDNLALALELVMEYIAQGKRDNLPEERMELLRTFKSQIFVLQAKAAAEMAPPPGLPAPGAPQAVPAAPPVSDMIPNLPV